MPLTASSCVPRIQLEKRLHSPRGSSLIPELTRQCMCHVSCPLLNGGPLLIMHERHLSRLLNGMRSLLVSFRIRQSVSIGQLCLLGYGRDVYRHTSEASETSSLSYSMHILGRVRYCISVVPAAGLHNSFSLPREPGMKGSDGLL